MGWISSLFGGNTLYGSDDDDGYTITIAGGIAHAGIAGPIANSFTGIYNGQQYVNGQTAPNGGTYDLDGYHAPDGTVWK